MSGFVALLHTDGAPVDADLLQSLTDTLAFRGPDGLRTWRAANMGMGHAMLRTTDDAARETQPCSLDRQVWITADARVDDRATLRRELAAAGRADTDSATDPELILHAYHAWGDDCVQHLLGDFSFVIWDAPRQRLFCARDHFGVKPFYYAHIGNMVALSNTLNTLRAHPAVSNTLNDLAIADFLLFGGNEEPDTTTFADIQRLPAAHTLIVEDGVLRAKRYWTLPIEDTIRYKRDEEYVEHFTALFEQAVRDRLRTNHVGVLMSGGLDSTSVAAVARDLLREQYADYDLRAHCVVYDRIIPDQERSYSGLAAQHLGIPIHYTVADDYKLYQNWEDYYSRIPEPNDETMWRSYRDHIDGVVSYSRVGLSGHGGDPGFYPAYDYFPKLIRSLRISQAISDVARFYQSNRKLPPLYIGSWLRKKLGREQEWQTPYTPWLNNEFAKRLHLRERLERFNQPIPSAHPTRSDAYKFLTTTHWDNSFEQESNNITGTPYEVRYPYFDLHLTRYLLRLPSVPWCVHKHLLRHAMRGRLPEGVRLRPKAPLAGNPVYEHLRRGEVDLQTELLWKEQCRRYVDPAACIQWLQMGAADAPPDSTQATRGMSLAYWLHFFTRS